MAVTSLMINAGSAFSPAFTLRGDRPMALFANSHAVVNWYVSFGQAVGGPFSRYMTENGSFHTLSFGGTDFSGVVRFPAGPFGRFELSAGATSSIAVTVVDVNRQ